MADSSSAASTASHPPSIPPLRADELDAPSVHADDPPTHADEATVTMRPTVSARNNNGADDADDADALIGDTHEPTEFLLPGA